MAAAKIREIAVLTLKTIGILRCVALYSRSPEFDHLSRLRQHLSARFTVVADNTAASRRRHQFSHASLSKAMRNLIPAMDGVTSPESALRRVLQF